MILGDETWESADEVPQETMGSPEDVPEELGEPPEEVPGMRRVICCRYWLFVVTMSIVASKLINYYENMQWYCLLSV